MPDICMCKGVGCPLRNACYRFTAEPSEYRQSYFTEEPFNPISGECEYQWPIIPVVAQHG